MLEQVELVTGVAGTPAPRVLSVGGMAEALALIAGHLKHHPAHRARCLLDRQGTPHAEVLLPQLRRALRQAGVRVERLLPHGLRTPEGGSVTFSSLSTDSTLVPAHFLVVVFSHQTQPSLWQRLWEYLMPRRQQRAHGPFSFSADWCAARLLPGGVARVLAPAGHPAHTRLTAPAWVLECPP